MSPSAERRDKCVREPEDKTLPERPTREYAIDCGQRGLALRICHDIGLMTFEWQGILVRKHQGITILQNQVPARFYHVRL